MQILIVSDSHGSTLNFETVLARRRTRDDALLYLGDGCADAELLARTYAIPSLQCVAGNCDRLFFGPPCGWDDETLLTLDGVRILMMHGHRYRLYGEGDEAERHARSLGAQVLLYGHTHEKENHRSEDGFYRFNPGSISRPRDGAPSFGTLTIAGGNLLFAHGIV